MRSELFFDITVLQDWNYSGVHQVCINLAKEFIQLGAPVIFCQRGHVVEMQIALDTFQSFSGARLRTEIQLKNLKPIDPETAMRSKCFYPHFRYDDLNWSGYSIVCHDLSPIIFSSAHQSATQTAAVKQLGDFVKAKNVIAVSHFTKDSLIKCLEGEIVPASVSVIHNGIKMEMPHATERTDQLKASNYFLYVGNLEPRKNLSTLIEALNLLDFDEEFTLAVVGSSSWGDIGELKCKHPITLLTNVNENEKTELMSNAELIVYPSIFEGFGLPIIEGYSVGVPVVCGTGSSLDEIVFDPSLKVDQTSAQSYANGLINTLKNKPNPDELKQIARNYTWTRQAKEYLKIVR